MPAQTSMEVEVPPAEAVATAASEGAVAPTAADDFVIDTTGVAPPPADIIKTDQDDKAAAAAAATAAGVKRKREEEQEDATTAGGEQTRRPPGRMDAQLIQAVREEVARQGGRARVFSLITYCPALRRLLGDRRLLDFLQQQTQHFVLERHTASTTAVAGRNGTRKHENVIIDVLLTQPLMLPNAGSHTTNEVTVTTTRQLLQRIEWRLEQICGCSIALAALVSNTRVKRSLVHYMRFQCSVFTTASGAWWETAFRAVFLLLRQVMRALKTVGK